MLDSSYDVIKKDNEVIYSQVILIDHNKLDVEFFNNRQLKYCISINNNGQKDGKWNEWFKDGKKKEEGTYRDGASDGHWTWWYENGQEEKEGKF